MVWRKLGKLCMIAVLLFILSFVSNNVISYKKTLWQGKGKEYKLNDKRSNSDLVIEKINARNVYNRRTEELHLVEKGRQKFDLRKQDNKEALHKQG